MCCSKSQFDRLSRGFTLIEALLSSVVMAVTVMAVSAMFYSGFQNLDDEARLLEKVNYASGKMDELISTEFSDITSGNDQVTVGGEQITRRWFVSLVDVDGNPGTEMDAKTIMMTVDDVEFMTIVVDSAGLVTCKR